MGRWGAVIVAAGRSSRLGQQKALLPIDGELLLPRLLRIHRQAGLDAIAVTTPALAEAARLATHDWIEGDSAEPMIDSYARGIAALAPEFVGAILQPVDAAFTDRAVIEALLAVVADKAVVPHYAGEPGHPIAVPRSYFSAIAGRPDGGLRTLLADAVVLDWPDPRILGDLDVPEDLVRWGLASK
jgi:molybdenum cofactor cytidylyltransferase